MTPQTTDQLLHSVLSLEWMEESFLHLREAAQEYEEEVVESLFNLLKLKFCPDTYELATQEVDESRDVSMAMSEGSSPSEFEGIRM